MEEKILSPTEENIEVAGRFLRNGNLVGFPTETVYGLGANALDERAVRKIFEYKRRPLTDPVIVHISSLDMVKDLADMDDKVRRVFYALSDAFWPGPLTMVVKASSRVPDVIGSGTGTIGIRFPAHPVAQKFISASGVPVAAPSANLFGHISPTTALHVYKDLGDRDILILDGGETNVGIESSVISLESDNGFVTVRILRKGKVTRGSIEEALGRRLKDGDGYKVVSVNQYITSKDTSSSPGQNITHYAPKQTTYILSSSSKGSAKSGHGIPIQSVVIIDFNGSLEQYRSIARGYYDLSPAGDIDEASSLLYHTLREAESLDEDATILITELRSDSKNEFYESVMDRITRAASGKRAALVGGGTLYEI